MKNTLHTEMIFMVMTAVNMKNILSWDMSPCSPVELQPRFGRTYYFLGQGRKENNEESFFDFKDGGSAFLRKFSELLPDLHIVKLQSDIILKCHLNLYNIPERSCEYGDEL
jgi:hypothetical protein